MSQITAFSLRDSTSDKRQEDFVLHKDVTTGGGQLLHIAIVCDGHGGGEIGEQAARHAAQYTIDYIETNKEKNVPKMLVEAIETANATIYEEFKGAATSTIALMAVDPNAPKTTYGRLYIASVGNSPIYLMRSGQLVRLNIDHTLVNEYVYAGQISKDQAARLQDREGKRPTRAIGIGPDVVVDIGFYVERGHEVNSQRAFNLGKQGMVLEEGDTLVAVSDGMTAINPQNQLPYVKEEEFLKHALDNNVERATRHIISYAAARHPEDNIAIAMMFVASRSRRQVHVIPRFTRTQKIGGGALVGLVLLTLIGAFVGIMSSEAQRRNLNATNAAFLFQLSATATNTPTATFTPTITPTPTQTVRPTLVDPLQIGIQYFEWEVADPRPLFINRPVSSEFISNLLVEGNNAASLPEPIEPVNVFLQEGSFIGLSKAQNLPQDRVIDLSLYPSSDFYSNTGPYFSQGKFNVSLLLKPNVQFSAESLCITAKQIPANINDPNDPEKVAFTCLVGDENSCTYTFNGTEFFSMPVGQRVLLDITNDRLIEVGKVQFEEIQAYYDSVVALTGSTLKTQCMSPYLDEDGDQILYPVDQCLDVVGTASGSGCPDRDGDTVTDEEDACPDEAGMVQLGGCPAPRTRIPDLDEDGLDGDDDLCPQIPGPPENYGCDRPITLTPSWTPTFTASFTPTPSLTPSNTASPSPSATFTPEPTATFTRIPATSIPPTATPTDEPTEEPPTNAPPATSRPSTSTFTPVPDEPTFTPLPPDFTPTATLTPLPPTATFTASRTPCIQHGVIEVCATDAPQPTPTHTFTLTPIPTNTFTQTPRPTDTPVPPTNTPEPPTNTPVPPTNTPEPPTATFTSAPPTP